MRIDTITSASVFAILAGAMLAAVLAVAAPALAGDDHGRKIGQQEDDGGPGYSERAGEGAQTSDWASDSKSNDPTTHYNDQVDQSGTGYGTLNEPASPTGE